MLKNEDCLVVLLLYVYFHHKICPELYKNIIFMRFATLTIVTKENISDKNIFCPSLAPF